MRSLAFSLLTLVVSGAAFAASPPEAKSTTPCVSVVSPPAKMARAAPPPNAPLAQRKAYLQQLAKDARAQAKRDRDEAKKLRRTADGYDHRAREMDRTAGRDEGKANALH